MADWSGVFDGVKADAVKFGLLLGLILLIALFAYCTTLF
jgi:hypothetical protein